MKKWVVSYLVLHILVSSLPAKYTIALFQIGNLITHYEHHSNEGHDHHVLSFLSDHYFGSHKDDGTHSHDDLPFQDHETMHQLVQTVYIFSVPAVDGIHSPMNIDPVLRINRSQLVHSTLFSGDIWHPPRV